MKLYFPTADADRCYNRAYFYMLMEEMSVEEIKAWPALADIGGPGFFCAAHHETGERGSGCEDCPEYEARNGRNGICKHWRHCRVPAEMPVTLKKRFDFVDFIGVRGWCNAAPFFICISSQYSISLGKFEP